MIKPNQLFQTTDKNQLINNFSRYFEPVKMSSTYKGMQKYELKGVVGEGAYGKVFMARNKETGDVGK